MLLTGIVGQEDARGVDKPDHVRQEGLGAGGLECHCMVWYGSLSQDGWRSTGVLVTTRAGKLEAWQIF